MKICTRCRENKPLSAFSSRAISFDGLQPACKSCNKEYKKAYYKKNKKRLDKINRAWVRKNKERAASIKMAYLLRYPDRRRASAAKYRSENKDACQKRISRWAKTARGKLSLRVRDRVRRIREKSQNPPTIDEVSALIKKQKGNCYWCKQKWGTRFEIDHVIPLARGGEHTISNIVISCPPCNRSKGKKMPWEWPGSNGLLL